MTIKERFEKLLDQLKENVFEKDTELGMSLLAALAGESVLLLGPPGVGKSMVARRVKDAFREAHSFEYLMSRFSTPDEIFGPVSISRLKTNDLYERNVEGFMPTADVVFLDEIWKAGPAILNTLLTIINEKVFRNGRDEIQVPMKLLIGASNELPADGEGLEALWDRFLVRIVSHCVKNEQNFYKILFEPTLQAPRMGTNDSLTITPEEYKEWQKQIAQIPVNDEVLTAITFIRKRLSNLRLDETEENANHIHTIYVSDRRWQHIVHLLRASAFVHGRAQVEASDLLPIVHCLWSEPIEIGPLRRLVVQSLLDKYLQNIRKMQQSMSVEVKRARARQALIEAQREGYHRDDNKQLFEGFNYRIDRFGTGNTYIFFVDYKNMGGYSRDNAPLEGVIYTDPQHPKVQFIRTMSDHLGMLTNSVAAQRVKLYRDADNIYINGVQYPIHQLGYGQTQPPLQGLSSTAQEVDYLDLIEQLSDQITATEFNLTHGNMLINEEDRQEINLQVSKLNHEMALMRVDAQKVMYQE